MKNLLWLIFIFTVNAFATTPSITCWQKTMKLEPSHMTVNYWCDAQFSYDMEAHKIMLVVDGWVSKAEKLAGASPVADARHIYFLPEGINTTLGNAGKLFLSTYVKSQPEFSGSVADQQ